MGESAPAFRCCVQSGLGGKRGRGDLAPKIVPSCSSCLIGLGANTEAKACDPSPACHRVLGTLGFHGFYFILF